MPSHDPHFIASAVSAITGQNVVHSTNLDTKSRTVHIDCLHKFSQDRAAPRSNHHPDDAAITVITLHGSVQVSFYHADTAIHIKQRIGNQLGVSLDDARLVFNGAHLEDHHNLKDHGVINLATLHVIHDTDFHLDPDLMVPRFSYDFRNLSNQNDSYLRGGEEYLRPYGWYRIALNVTHYGDMTWLGMTGNNPGEWAVSYHGTRKGAAEKIADGGFDMQKGTRFAHGHGIYSAPDPAVGEGYATVFSHGGNDYKVILQNRVNMDDTDVIPHSKTGDGTYYVTHHEDSIRPYGLLIKEF